MTKLLSIKARNIKLDFMRQDMRYELRVPYSEKLPWQKTRDELRFFFSSTDYPEYGYVIYIFNELEQREKLIAKYFKYRQDLQRNDLNEYLTTIDHLRRDNGTN